MFAAFEGCFRGKSTISFLISPILCKIEWWYSPRLQMKISLETGNAFQTTGTPMVMGKRTNKISQQWGECFLTPLKLAKECCVVAWAWAECKGLWVLVLTLAGVGTLAIFLSLAVPLFLILKGNVMEWTDQSILAMLQGATENLGQIPWGAKWGHSSMLKRRSTPPLQLWSHHFALIYLLH